MANDYSKQPLTGRYDRKQIDHAVSALVAFPVREERLSESTDVLNDATKSGKQAGAMFTVYADNWTTKLAIAQGSHEMDNWCTTTLGEMIVPQ